MTRRPNPVDQRGGSSEQGAATTGLWLLLVHQLPASPSRARVKTWRRLQQLGAVAVRNAVYVLPNSPQAREDFEWMRAEIAASKGEATVFAADTVDALAHDDIVRAFRADREGLFETIRRDARTLTRKAARAGAMRGTRRRSLQRSARQVRDRFAQVAATDYFGAGGREEAHTAIVELERLVVEPAAGSRERPGPRDALRLEDYRKRIWVTRPRPGIDRSSSAWLIRRFIDPAARFEFGDSPPASGNAVPFDMYDVEFSHNGARCTFEVLSERFGITDPAVVRIGHLVHDLDLKEHRYNVPEAPTVGRLIDGLEQVFSRDEDLLEHGTVIFEALYRSFASALQPADVTGSIRRRARHRKKGR